MPQLHTFTFYFACENHTFDPSNRISNLDIEQTFTNIKYKNMMSMIDYCEPYHLIWRVFSLPFEFDRLEHISNNIPNLIFRSVTYLTLWDKHAFKHEFFPRLVRSFLFLKHLSISNIKSPSLEIYDYHLRDEDWRSLIEYSYLNSLDIKRVDIYYVEQFLNETKTCLPNLIQLKICYKNLQSVTKNFKNNQMRRNCSNIKQLFVDVAIAYSKDVYDYFPSLSM